jgi:uncharacterized protein YodC (DUF2158 family)
VEEPKFKLGDVVRVKGQWINLTVISESNSFTRNYVGCVWFNNGVSVRDEFPANALELVNLDVVGKTMNTKEKEVR